MIPHMTPITAGNQKKRQHGPDMTYDYSLEAHEPLDTAPEDCILAKRPPATGPLVVSPHRQQLKQTSKLHPTVIPTVTAIASPIVLIVLGSSSSGISSPTFNAKAMADKRDDRLFLHFILLIIEN